MTSGLAGEEPLLGIGEGHGPNANTSSNIEGKPMPKVPVTPVGLTVGEAAERSGLAVSALHFYEAQGLISSRRTTGNQRRFRRDTLRRVAFIRAPRREGIPLRG